jgi:hypothetical protein
MQKRRDGRGTAELGSGIKCGTGHGQDRRNGGDSVGESGSGDGDSVGENGSREKDGDGEEL